MQPGGSCLAGQYGGGTGFAVGIASRLFAPAAARHERDGPMPRNVGPGRRWAGQLFGRRPARRATPGRVIVARAGDLRAAGARGFADSGSGGELGSRRPLERMCRGKEKVWMCRAPVALSGGVRETPPRMPGNTKIYRFPQIDAPSALSGPALEIRDLSWCAHGTRPRHRSLRTGQPLNGIRKCAESATRKSGTPRTSPDPPNLIG